MKLRSLLIPAFALTLASFNIAAADASKPILFIVTSESLQTQGMSMVLANALIKQGHSVDVLLCDGAGDLALKSHNSQLLKPMGVTPEGLMKTLMQAGGRVNVCALYLPNKSVGREALRDSVGVANPADVASMISNPDVKVVSN